MPNPQPTKSEADRKPVSERWRVWRSDCPGGEDEALTFAEAPGRWRHRRLADARDAAEQWGEDVDCDSAEYAIVAQRDEPVVTVEDLKTGERSHWQVEGESVAEYRARPYDQRLDREG